MKAFNTFATNSPRHSQYQSPRMPSSNLLNPSNADSREQELLKTAHFVRDTFKKIPSAQIKKEDIQEQNSFEEDNNHSEVSLLLSQISVPSPSRLQYDAKRLFTLENNITQHVLELRQQKITLMQELSRCIDTKNLYEHYILKKSKEDDRMTNYDSRINPIDSLQASPGQQIVPTRISALILKRNQDLHRKLKELKVREEIFGPSYREVEPDEEQNKKILEQIMEARQMNNRLQQEISTKIKNSSSNARDSRFVTFQPQDRAKHQEMMNSSGELQMLKQRYAKLSELNNEPGFKLSEEEGRYVQELRRENQELLRQAEMMLQQKQVSKLPKLRQRMDQNEREKAIFIHQLQNFKQKMRAIKQQNMRLKQELNR